MAKKSSNQSKFQINNKYNRHFSEAFKKAKVKEIVEGRLSIKELCELYSVTRTSVYKWLYKYSAHHQRGTRQVIEMESEAAKTKALLAQIAELERIIGQKQLQLDYQDKLLELVSEELGYDVKKNIERLPSNGSGLTDPNTATK